MKAFIWNNKWWVEETDPYKLRNRFSDLLALADFEIIDFTEHYFHPHGYTALWLLGESHLALHSFPEEGKTYVELSSCNEKKHLFFTANIGDDADG